VKRLNRYMTALERLEAGCMPVPESGCWIWLGSTDKDGYGQIQVEPGLRMGPHRFSLSVRIGRPVHPDKFACHKCDTPSCVNPDHLYEGDIDSNAADKVSRGRQSTGDKAKRRQRGEQHYAHKLNEIQVNQIRNSSEPASLMALRFGVSKRAIFMIRHGRTWKHLLEKCA
jgi:hypothetical protein